MFSRHHVRIDRCLQHQWAVAVVLSRHVTCRDHYNRCCLQRRVARLYVHDARVQVFLQASHQLHLLCPLLLCPLLALGPRQRSAIPPLPTAAVAVSLCRSASSHHALDQAAAEKAHRQEHFPRSTAHPREPAQNPKEYVRFIGSTFSSIATCVGPSRRSNALRTDSSRHHQRGEAWVAAVATR